MAQHMVEAIFAIFYGTTTHKAVYGRDVEDDSYSKDYIQLTQSDDFRETLERLFPRQYPGEPSTSIEYRWPGGGRHKGSIEFQSADRPHLAWLKTDGPPPPWRMTPTPSLTTVESIPGDPTATDPAVAKQQLDNLLHNDIQPYLVAVKLKGEENVLHLRVYLENPPAGMEAADVHRLPGRVKDVVTSTSRTRTFKWAVMDSHASLMTPDLTGLVERLEQNPAVLLVGPPGTGKTVLLEQLAEFIENPGQGTTFDPDHKVDEWGAAGHGMPGKSRTVVLHPSYSYDNLVVGLLPEPTPEGATGIQATTGPLVNLAHYTSQPGRRSLLVLDEFNRANAAGVLGDTLALLDQDKRGAAFVDLPYSGLGLDVPEEFRANGTTRVDPRFSLPPNLWIVAAMNTSDRSVAPLDAALRRRFTIVEMQPDLQLLAQHLMAADREDLEKDFEDWTVPHVGRLAVELLHALNARIDSVLGVDFRLGHSNFWHVRGETVDEAVLSLAAAFDHRIVQNLRLSLQDDDGALAAILRAGTPQKSMAGHGNHTAWWRHPDEELGAFGASRLMFQEVASLESGKLLAELRRQAGV